MYITFIYTSEISTIGLVQWKRTLTHLCFAHPALYMWDLKDSMNLSQWFFGSVWQRDL